MNDLPRHAALRIVLAVTVGCLAGCASYHPLPLTEREAARHDLRQLARDAGRIDLPGLEAHPIDPEQPLDITSVAMLAVVGNPDLRLARADAGIASAQAFAAGLLPDPQINLTRDFPGRPGYVPAFNAGIAFDFGSLVTLAARRAAAAADQRKVDLALLWQEWQVVARARKLFAGIDFLERHGALLQQALALSGQRVEAVRRALDAGNATIDALAPHLVTQADARRQRDEQMRELRLARLALNALLGLPPDAQLALAALPPPPAFDPAAVDDALRNLPARRPDLRALAAGYAAQEERLRAAVLSQFPSLNIGFTRARDTSALFTSGYTLAVALPSFNANRGGIAVETATRQRLRDEYRNRIDAARDDVLQIVADQAELETRLRAARASAAALARTAAAAEAAWQARDLTLASYIDLQSALLAARVQVIALERTAYEQRIALQSLLGGEVPPAHMTGAVRRTSNEGEGPR